MHLLLQTTLFLKYNIHHVEYTNEFKKDLSLKFLRCTQRCVDIVKKLTISCKVAKKSTASGTDSAAKVPTKLKEWAGQGIDVIC